MFKENKRNFIWLAIQYLVLISSAFITLKINLDYFGKDAFGYWILISSIWGFGVTLDLGFGVAIIKFVAELNKNRFDELKELLSSAFYLFIILGSIISVVIYSVGNLFYLGNPKLVDSNYITQLSGVLIFLGVAFYLRFLSIFFKSILEGLNDYYSTSRINIAYNLLILSSVITVSVFELSLVDLAKFYILSAFLLLMFYLIRVRKQLGSINFHPSYFSLASLKKIFKFSLSVQAVNILGRSIDPVIKYILGYYLDVSIISYYEIARRFAMSITGLFDNTFRPFLTKAGSLLTKKEQSGFLVENSLKLSNFGISYSGVMYGVLSLLFAALILVVYGYQQSVFIFLILSLAEVINKFGYSIYVFLLGTGKGLLLVAVQITNLVSVILFLSFSLILFKNPFGLIGYFISVVLGNVVMLVYVTKFYELSFYNIFNRIDWQKLLLLIFALLGTVMLYYISNYNIYAIIPLSVLSIIIFYGDAKNNLVRIYSSYKSNKFN